MISVKNSNASIIKLPSIQGGSTNTLKSPGSGFAKKWLVNPFRPIGLKQLNAKAAMLERLDNKYVVRETVLRQAVTELVNHFDILEIDGKRSFTYETYYFDDDKNTSYFDHHQGRRQRFKVRVRNIQMHKYAFLK